MSYEEYRLTDSELAACNDPDLSLDEVVVEVASAQFAKLLPLLEEKEALLQEAAEIIDGLGDSLSLCLEGAGPKRSAERKLDKALDFLDKLREKGVQDD